MRHSGEFFSVNALLLTLVLSHGSFCEVSGLIHKSKAMKAGPSSAPTRTTWNIHRKNTDHFRSSSQLTIRQRDRCKESIDMNLAHGNFGVEKYRQESMPSPAFRRLLLASMLTVVAVWRTKAVIAPLRYMGWILSDIIYKPYQNSLVNNPLVTKVITGAVLAIAGDAMAQATSNETTLANNQIQVKYDKRRALSFAVFDSCYRVFQHNMFPLIIRFGQGNVVKHLLPKFFIPAAAAIEQTALYQFVIVPCLYYPIFFAFTGFIQGLSFRQSIIRMKKQYFPCWRRNLMFWIPTQMVLFGVVAEKWQIPFACLMGMLWSMILSKTAGNTKKK